MTITPLHGSILAVLEEGPSTCREIGERIDALQTVVARAFRNRLRPFVRWQGTPKVFELSRLGRATTFHVENRSRLGRPPMVSASDVYATLELSPEDAAECLSVALVTLKRARLRVLPHLSAREVRLLSMLQPGAATARQVARVLGVATFEVPATITHLQQYQKAPLCVSVPYGDEWLVRLTAAGHAALNQHVVVRRMSTLATTRAGLMQVRDLTEVEAAAQLGVTIGAIRRGRLRWPCTAREHSA